MAGAVMRANNASMSVAIITVHSNTLSTAAVDTCNVSASAFGLYVLPYVFYGPIILESSAEEIPGECDDQYTTKHERRPIHQRRSRIRNAGREAEPEDTEEIDQSYDVDPDT